MTEQVICRVCNSVSDNMKKCSKCQSSYYCSKECQHQDWPTHKHICYSSTEFGGLSAYIESTRDKTINKTSTCCMLCGVEGDDVELLERDTGRMCVPCITGVQEVYADQLENIQHKRASRSSATSSKPIYIVESYQSLCKSLSDDVYKQDIERVETLVLLLRGSVNEVKMHRYKAYTLNDYKRIISGLDDTLIDLDMVEDTLIDLDMVEDTFVISFRFVCQLDANKEPVIIVKFVPGYLPELSRLRQDIMDKLGTYLIADRGDLGVKLKEINIYFVSNGTDDWKEEDFRVVMTKEEYDNKHFQTKSAD